MLVTAMTAFNLTFVEWFARFKSENKILTFEVYIYHFVRLTLTVTAIYPHVFPLFSFRKQMKYDFS